ncbi:MAG: hypothetical protein AAF748_06000 [Pseudomonadota bacterium]
MSDDAEATFAAYAETASASGHQFLSPIGPVMLAAAALGIAMDTRTFARVFDVAHALAIRECTSLSHDLGLLDAQSRGDRSQRQFYALTAQGAALFPPDAA